LKKLSEKAIKIKISIIALKTYTPRGIIKKLSSFLGEPAEPFMNVELLSVILGAIIFFIFYMISFL